MHACACMQLTHRAPSDLSIYCGLGRQGWAHARTRPATQCMCTRVPAHATCTCSSIRMHTHAQSLGARPRVGQRLHTSTQTMYKSNLINQPRILYPDCAHVHTPSHAVHTQTQTHMASDLLSLGYLGGPRYGPVPFFVSFHAIAPCE